MNNLAYRAAAILAALGPLALANPVSHRAIITGAGGNGRCTIEVTVDGAAEVEVSADMGLLTTTSGQPAAWRRFQCNTPLPPKPADFRVVRDGNRGNIRLLQDPRSTGGRAVIRINDPKGGRGAFTFDLQWRGPGGGGWAPGPAVPPSVPPPGPHPGPPPGHWPAPGGFPPARAIRSCQHSVTARLNHDGYQYVSFESTIPVDNPGPNDWITGSAIGTRGFGNTRFSFSCSVDFSSGHVRSVHVHRHW
jgi:hypothetical protein